MNETESNTPLTVAACDLANGFRLTCEVSPSERHHSPYYTLHRPDGSSVALQGPAHASAILAMVAESNR